MRLTVLSWVAVFAVALVLSSSAGVGPDWLEPSHFRKEANGSALNASKWTTAVSRRSFPDPSRDHLYIAEQRRA